jgi:sodium/potassium/calcium exchanger 6
MEFQEPLDSEFPIIDELAEEDENINFHTNIPGSYGLKLLLKDLTKHANFGRNLLLDNLSPEPSLLDHQHGINEDLNNDNDDNSINRPFTPYYDNMDIINSEPQLETTNEYIKFLFVLLPSLRELEKSNLVYKVYYIATLPIGFILRISIPVRDETHIEMLNAKVANTHIGSNFNFDFDSFILAIQTYFGTIMLTYVSFGGISTFWTYICPLAVIAATVLAGLVFVSYKAEFKSSSVLLKIVAYSTSVLGFMVSIAWISLFATEIINVLKSISVIFNLSDEILGLTVFTIGNSLADFISNITISRMGMPLMAYGACFGGPLISLCSLGFSGSIIIPNSKVDSYTFDVNITILITSIFLVGNILMLLYAVPRNNWMIDRKIGTILVLSWAFSTLINVIIETI